MAERVLTERELNRAVLGRQLLLERRKLGPAEAIEQIGGLQTQYAPSGYIGLWSRLDGFARADLTAALESRTVVQATVMRSTIHTVTAADYPLFVAAVRETRRESWLRAHRRQIAPEVVADAAERTRGLLAAGPRRSKDLMQELGMNNVIWNGIGLWLDLVRVPPSGTWERRRADLFGSAEEWLGRADVSQTEALELIVRRYLRAFGPATIADIAGWAGIPAGDLDPALATLTLRRFRSERDEELLDLPRMPIPDGAASAPPRFLPTWDANLLVHTRRTGILPEQYRPLIFSSKNPQSVPTFLIDGRVAGTWRFDDGDDRIRIEPFEPIPHGARRELDREAEALARFHR
jgi:Winged helix DNA-binding domain